MVHQLAQKWLKRMSNLIYKFSLDQKESNISGFFKHKLQQQKTKNLALNNYDFRKCMASPCHDHFFHVSNFYKIPLMSAPEFCHQITCDVPEGWQE